MYFAPKCTFPKFSIWAKVSGLRFIIDKGLLEWSICASSLTLGFRIIKKGEYLADFFFTNFSWENLKRKELRHKEFTVLPFVILLRLYLVFWLKLELFSMRLSMIFAPPIPCSRIVSISSLVNWNEYQEISVLNFNCAGVSNM